MRGLRDIMNEIPYLSFALTLKRTNRSDHTRKHVHKLTRWHETAYPLAQMLLESNTTTLRPHPPTIHSNYNTTILHMGVFYIRNRVMTKQNTEETDQKQNPPKSSTLSWLIRVQ